MAQLAEADLVSFGYEDFKIPYIKPESRHTFIPDIWLGNGIVVELKGLFTSDDRKKMRIVKATYPDLDIRMVFSNSRTPIRKGSKTSYARWAEDNGFPFADKRVPVEWLSEPLNEASMLTMRTFQWKR